MLLRYKVPAPNGINVITFGNHGDTRNYEFLPNAEGAFVCEVADEGDAATMLAIEEGYEEFVPEGERRRSRAKLKAAAAAAEAQAKADAEAAEAEAEALAAAEAQALADAEAQAAAEAEASAGE